MQRILVLKEVITVPPYTYAVDWISQLVHKLDYLHRYTRILLGSIQ